MGTGMVGIFSTFTHSLIHLFTHPSTIIHSNPQSLNKKVKAKLTLEIVVHSEVKKMFSFSMGITLGTLY